MDRRALAAVLALAATAVACGGDDGGGSAAGSSNPTAQVEVGRTAFEATCAACHGADLRGTGSGPPLLHAIYAPDHHPDDSFRAAVARGVQPHHWDFGPMPAQPRIPDDDVDAIIAYVRDRQRDAGITDDPGH